MNKNEFNLVNDLNKGIIKCRNIYSLWASRHGISYGEMLVLYMLREYGYVRQKDICDSYIVPKQTINNVIFKMRNDNLLIYDDKHSMGNIKAFCLTKEGKKYASSLFGSMDKFESCAIALMGLDRLKILDELLADYDKALNEALREENGR